MKNHTEIGLQYGKLHALYETIIYLQKEIEKEKAKLEKLKEEEKHG
jgi:cell division protein FtsB